MAAVRDERRAFPQGSAWRFLHFQPMPSIIRSFFLKIAKILRQLLLFTDDVLVLAGLLIILWSNFRVNEFFGWYSTGLLLVVCGLFAARLIGRSKVK